MIKLSKEFRSLVRDDRGFIGGGGIIERLIPFGLGLFALALLSFPVRMIWPDSQIAQPVSTIQVDPVAQAVQLAGRGCVMSKTDYYLTMYEAYKAYNLN
ncbi:MAG: hypothetical protein D084_Lepto4C00333G0002 [Leptospirillum sp. Group IV 'UBA BS']|jgi:hypothetical protein|nr:MAG: hypothetical protein D084_Lepto4C00333G0002 [Leptospirillum sp. Group IV 'UBA BS']